MDITRTRGEDIVIIDPDLTKIPEIENRLPGRCFDIGRIWRINNETWQQIEDLFADIDVRKSMFGAKRFIDNIRPALQQLPI